MPGMKNVIVIQHTEAEWLGLIEDHLESRNVGFSYVRPFANRGWVPPRGEEYDALILLGAGPWGTASEPLLPSLKDELKLARNFLARNRPVIGFGLGAQILTLAAGGSVEACGWQCACGTARRRDDKALNGFLPEAFPQFIYMRDRAVPPGDAQILAEDEGGRPALFQIGGNCLGFAGHPGIKSGMIEDYVMEFDDSPESVADGLTMLRGAQRDIAEALSHIMVGLVQIAGLMRPPLENPPQSGD
jgi:GMP synthase-like glutamine amidotransferase